MYAHLWRGNRDIFVPALGGSSRAASGRPEAVADDERGEEVRLADNTCEAGEQSGPPRCGAGEGKQRDSRPLADHLSSTSLAGTQEYRTSATAFQASAPP